MVCLQILFRPYCRVDKKFPHTTSFLSIFPSQMCECKFQEYYFFKSKNKKRQQKNYQEDGIKETMSVILLQLYIDGFILMSADSNLQNLDVITKGGER